jgi:hypothetical protein
MHEEEAIFKGRLGGITAGSQVVNKGVKLGLMSHIFPKISMLLGSYKIFTTPPPHLQHNCHLPANIPLPLISPSLSFILALITLLIAANIIFTYLFPIMSSNSSWSFFTSWIHLAHHAALLK